MFTTLNQYYSNIESAFSFAGMFQSYNHVMFCKFLILTRFFCPRMDQFITNYLYDRLYFTMSAIIKNIVIIKYPLYGGCLLSAAAAFRLKI